MGLFSVGDLRGNPFVIGILFGSVEISGIFIGEKILSYKIKDTIGSIVATIVFLGASNFLKD